jgi:hypothetical protein
MSITTQHCDLTLLKYNHYERGQTAKNIKRFIELVEKYISHGSEFDVFKKLYSKEIIILETFKENLQQNPMNVEKDPDRRRYLTILESMDVSSIAADHIYRNENRIQNNTDIRTIADQMKYNTINHDVLNNNHSLMEILCALGEYINHIDPITNNNSPLRKHFLNEDINSKTNISYGSIATVAAICSWFLTPIGGAAIAAIGGIGTKLVSKNMIKKDKEEKMTSISTNLTQCALILSHLRSNTEASQDSVRNMQDFIRDTRNRERIINTKMIELDTLKNDKKTLDDANKDLKQTLLNKNNIHSNIIKILNYLENVEKEINSRITNTFLTLILQIKKKNEKTIFEEFINFFLRSNPSNNENETNNNSDFKMIFDKLSIIPIYLNDVKLKSENIIKFDKDDEFISTEFNKLQKNIEKYSKEHNIIKLLLENTIFRNNVKEINNNNNDIMNIDDKEHLNNVLNSTKGILRPIIDQIETTISTNSRLITVKTADINNKNNEINTHKLIRNNPTQLINFIDTNQCLLGTRLNRMRMTT